MIEKENKKTQNKTMSFFIVPVILVLITLLLFSCSDTDKKNGKKLNKAKNANIETQDLVPTIVKLIENEPETWSVKNKINDYDSREKKINFIHVSGVVVTQTFKKIWLSDPWESASDKGWEITKPTKIKLTGSESDDIYDAYSDWVDKEIKKDKTEVYNLLK